MSILILPVEDQSSCQVKPPSVGVKKEGPNETRRSESGVPSEWRTRVGLGRLALKGCSNRSVGPGVGPGPGLCQGKEAVPSLHVYTDSIFVRVEPRRSWTPSKGWARAWPRGGPGGGAEVEVVVLHRTGSRARAVSEERGLVRGWGGQVPERKVEAAWQSWDRRLSSWASRKGHRLLPRIVTGTATMETAQVSGGGSRWQ